MSGRVEAIENQVKALTSDELTSFRQFVREFDAEAWTVRLKPMQGAEGSMNWQIGRFAIIRRLDDDLDPSRVARFLVVL